MAALLVIEGALSYGGAPSLRERLVAPGAAPDAAPLREQRGPWVDHEDVRVGRTLVPDRDELVVDGQRVATDALGLRRVAQPDVPDDARRLVVLGGARVFGAGLDDEATLVAALADAWRAARPSRPVRVVPVALPGWTLRASVAFLGDHLDELAPDAVVVFPGVEALADTVGAGRDGTLGVQCDPLSERPWMRVGRARLGAALAELARARRWGDEALAGPWWLEVGAGGFASRRLDDAAALVASVARRSDVPWLLVDDARGILSRVHERLDGMDVALMRAEADVAAAPPIVARLTRGRDDGADEPVPPAPLASLSDVIDLRDGRGALQLHGGLAADGAFEPALVAVLRREPGRDRLRLRVRPLAEGPRRIELAVSVDGIPVGRAVVEGPSADVVDEVWTCAPTTSVRACDVVLAADATVVRDGGRRLASAVLVSLSFE